MGSELPSDTVFASYEEVKVAVGSKKVLKIFLIDRAGRKHLAATGEDLGDAHYLYKSTKPFSKYGRLECHNRNELHIWLEMVISESSGPSQAAHLGGDEQHPEGVYFLSHRYERAVYPDGRRLNRWYLMDQHGNSHLAVLGIERDTKDGHYQYSAEEPFAGILPLHCSNQSGVFKWLEAMITHHAGTDDAPTPAGSYGGGPTGSTTSDVSGGDVGAAGGRKPPLIINLATIRAARKSVAALHSLEQACVITDGQPVRPKAKPKALPAAPPPLPISTTQKHKSVGIVQQNQIKKARKLQDDLRAEEEKLQAAHLARMRRAAAAEVAGDTAAKATSLSWLHCSLSEEEAEHLEHWLGLLNTILDMQDEQQQQQARQEGGKAANQQQGYETAAAAAEAGKDSSSDAAADAAAGAAAAAACAPGETGDIMVWIKQPANRRHHLRVALECLKELGAQDLPAREPLTRQVIQIVQRCLAWQDDAVISMARHMLRRWRWQLAGHMHVLGCATYLEDHLGALEEDIQEGLVPLPQLPKHKQALLDTPIPKLPLLNAATPAPARFNSYSSSSHQHYHMLDAAGMAGFLGMTPGAGGWQGAGAGGVPGLAAAAGGLRGGASAGYLDPAAAAMFGGGWPAPQGGQMMGLDGAGGSGKAAGAASGSSTDLAAMTAAAAAAGGSSDAAAAQAQQQQQMALYAMQQQHMNPSMQMQYGSGAAAAAGLDAQQQQQLTLQWQQQQQQAMYWQQQQHMHAVWASGQQGASSGLTQQQQQQPAISQPQQ
ncbi:hypothetical protein COO60DRAFT_458910 [Scenedesmus sp. NREL 46B-D3]|nr:hypothetical protein COO60DRAFT_458910 [Scenedesmus sp. NREL 46B-D3]